LPIWTAFIDLGIVFDFVQAEVKRLTALVEEAAQNNRKLIALGSKSCPLAFLSRYH
jgi:mRNA degradation ribonuclease J1/J2